MLFVAYCRDKETGLQIRRRNLAAHLEYLRANAGAVLVAGSLRREGDDVPVRGHVDCGGPRALWLPERWRKETHFFAPDSVSTSKSIGSGRLFQMR